jgi:hypothetical protein
MKIIFLLIDEKNKKNPVFVDKIKMTKIEVLLGLLHQKVDI